MWPFVPRPKAQPVVGVGDAVVDTGENRLLQRVKLAVDNVEVCRLPARDDAVRAVHDERPGGAEVDVVLLVLELLRRRPRRGHAERVGGAAELHEAVAVRLFVRVVVPVAGEHVDVAVTIGRRSSPALPDTSAFADARHRERATVCYPVAPRLQPPAGGVVAHERRRSVRVTGWMRGTLPVPSVRYGVERTGIAQVGGSIAKHPAVVFRDVLVLSRAERRVNVPVIEQQRRGVALIARNEVEWRRTVALYRAAQRDRRMYHSPRR